MRGVLRRWLKRRSSASTFDPVVSTLYDGAGRAVPADFIGLHVHRWPQAREGVAAVTAEPSSGGAIWRTHAYSPKYNGGVHWAGIHLAAGTFDWSYLDTAIDAHYAAGRRTMFNVYQCPTWAAKTAMQGTAGPFGLNGEGAPPQNTGTRDGNTNVYVDLYDFVKTLVTRYNTDTVRNNGGIKKIGWLDVWNEPTFDQIPGSTRYFWGTAAEMAAMARTVKLAAKSVDNAIVVMSPAFSTLSSDPISAFLAASDGASGFGRDHIEALTYHPYYVSAPGLPLLGDTPAALDAKLKAQMVAGGLAESFPIYANEQSFAAGPTDQAVFWTKADQALYIRRISMLQAALGWKTTIWYCYDDELLGRPDQNTLVAAALSDAHHSLAGRTIERCEIHAKGRVRLTLANNVVVTI